MSDTVASRYYDTMTTPKAPTDRKKSAQPRKRAQPSSGVKEVSSAGKLKTVTFQGRQIAVKCPTEEQIFAWERLLTKMETMTKEAATIDTARTLLNRCNKIIDSVIADPADREWMEDGRLDGTVNMKDAAQIVIDALAAYEAELGRTAPTNRAARRAKA